MAENLTTRLQRFFGFKATKVSTGFNKEKIIVEPVSKDTKIGSKNVKLPSDVQKLWDWYTSQTSDTSETLRHRFDRYKDLDYMVFNDPIFSFCVDLYADESAQADDKFNLIKVDAQDTKVKKEIEKLLALWGIDQNYIRETAYNLTLYGDSFDIIDSNEKKGITAIEQIDVRSVTNRLEFKYSEIKKIKDGGKTPVNSTAKETINKFISEIEASGNKGDSSQYASYLFGFTLDDSKFVYPWQINHVRLKSNKSEFWPYGRPLFINLVGPFRQLKTAKNLMALTRAKKFPKEIYEVQTSDQMDSVEKWEAVNEARTEFSNLGTLNQAKDEFSVGDEVWIPDGLIKHTSIQNDMRIEDIADIQLLRDDFIMGTKVPKGYLIVDQGGWGNSGQSLLQQSKAFGRSVFTIQSAILVSLNKLIRMHFLMTGEFQKDLTEFQISLNYPVIEQASDQLRMKTDTLRLASDIMKEIKDAFGLRDELPPELIKKIFKAYSFLEPEEVDDYINLTSKFVDKKKKESVEEITKKFNERFSEETIKTAVFDVYKENNIKEWVKNGEHHYFSSEKAIKNDEKNIYKFMKSYGLGKNILDEEEK